MTGGMTGGAMSGDMGDIVEVASSNPDFSTLVTAIEAAGLVETLQGEGPFTVFAPTNDAFAAIPEDDLNALLEDPEALSNILLYHVVEGAVTADQVVELTSATTVQGSDVSVSVEGDTVMVGDATVIMPDVMASNGVIHAIDTVLMPE
jgi:uncharacterized surface protein with fasciclin (FAS1) repeats